MEKIVIQVPKGIRYISDFEKEYGFQLEEFPYILDKKVPGCGFTSWCLSNSQNIILASPRRMLMNNKKEQFGDSVFLVSSTEEEIPNVDKDLTKFNKGKYKLPPIPPFDWAELKRNLIEYILKRKMKNLPAKIIVTYDSYRKVKEILTESRDFQSFYTVVDEFQSILVDATFRASTEIEFLSALEGVQRVCYVSATPMMDSYLELISQFNNLPYYEFDWFTLEPGRIIHPNVIPRVLKSVNLAAKTIIEPYKNGKFDQKFFINPVTHEAKNVESREAVIYVNSVTNIIGIIKACGLKPEEVNILCSNTPFNQKRISDRLNKKRQGIIYQIGKVPLRDEPRKMITLCTRTVYLGADFYSDNAKSYVISDANIETLAVDITLDLPQIMGRQRLIENPWKDEVTIYIKSTMKYNAITEEEFAERIKMKIEKTQSLLRSYDTVLDIDKNTLAEVYLDRAKDYNYKRDYVAVNRHAGKSPIPVFNDLVAIAERRAYDIQQIDYKDRFTVMNRMIESGMIVSPEETLNVQLFLDKFYKECKNTSTKMKLLCETIQSGTLSQAEVDQIFLVIPNFFQNFYYGLGPERCKTMGYNYTRMDKEYNMKFFNLDNVLNKVLENFHVGDKLSNIEVKDRLREIYASLRYKKTPKASDLEEWFEVKTIKLKDSSGKWVHGIELVRVK